MPIFLSVLPERSEPILFNFILCDFMRNFTYEEFFRSTTAAKLGIDNLPEDGYVLNEVYVNIRKLVENVLQPLRDAIGAPIYINSGYRCTALNRAVGGALNSMHLTGRAADITCFSNRTAAYELIHGDIDFDQLIIYPNYKWLHVSYVSPEDNRHQVIRKY